MTWAVLLAVGWVLALVPIGLWIGRILRRADEWEARCRAAGLGRPIEDRTPRDSTPGVSVSPAPPPTSSSLSEGGAVDQGAPQDRI